MKVVNSILKALAVLAAIAGIVYVVATYGDRIVAWCKRLLNCGCCCGEDCCCDEECCCDEDCCCDETCCCEEAKEPCCCEEAPAEEPVPAEESDFEA